VGETILTARSDDMHFSLQLTLAALQELRRATEAAKEVTVNQNGGRQSDHEHEEK